MKKAKAIVRQIRRLKDLIRGYEINGQQALAEKAREERNKLTIELGDEFERGWD